jgi:DNA-binding CsgD family transcriptional regulator
MITYTRRRHHLGDVFFLVGDGRSDWNTKAQLQALQHLLSMLPGPEAPPVERKRLGQKQARCVSKRLKSTQVDELIEACKAGVTTYQLAERFGIKRQTVSAILKRNGITPRWRRLAEANIDESERLYLQGLSLVRIADRLKVDPGTVHYHLRKRGVQMRIRTIEVDSSKYPKALYVGRMKIAFTPGCTDRRRQMMLKDSH